MYTVPTMTGRRVVVTGANSGTGEEAVARLAGAGARVVMAVRTPQRGEAARARVLRRHPGADVEVRRLDLADLGSVREFADGLLDDGQPLDALVNNAGVMAVPSRMTTAEGFELQLGTNYLGPFALTLRLLPLLLRTPGARVATMSSSAAAMGRVRFADLQLERRYGAWRAYAQSKLADLLMTRHLAVVAERRGWDLLSTGAHPGFTQTNLQSTGPNLGRAGSRTPLLERFAGVMPTQQVDVGTEPLMFAVADPGAEQGGYYGPTGRLGMVGPTGPATLPRSARDLAVAARLWRVSEDLVGVSLPATV